MRIFGKPGAEYIPLQVPTLAMIAVVGLLRLGLSLVAVPDSIVRWLSLTVLLLIGMVYAAIRVQRSGFGGYRHLLPVVFFQVLTAQTIIIAGIAIGILTQRGNVFTRGGATWGHAVAHILAIVSLSVVFWAIGSLVMLALKPASHAS